MSAPHVTDTGKEAPMSRKDRRWIAAGAAVVALGGVVLWTAAYGRAEEGRAAPGAAGHSDHAPVPDPHAGHDMPVVSDQGVVRLDAQTARSLGVTVVEAELAPLAREIRTTGNVVFDETRQTTIAPKFAGFVERLYVDFTGQPVRRGQPLLEIYSPELVAAQEELLSALRMERQLRESAAPAVVERTAVLVEAARRRLLLWDVSPAQVRAIEQSGRVRRTLTLHAPSGGFVTEKMVQSGQAVEMGMPLYRLADLSTVWVEADVYEQDLRFVRTGEAAEVEIAAYPGEPLRGRVAYVYPEVRTDTRTTRVRVELPNPGGRIKPGMYASVSLESLGSERAVVVPRDAVMYSGTHAMVFVEEIPGRYRAREVDVGIEAGGMKEILHGLAAGERVVARANFLLDSESRISDDLGAMPGMNH
jgi:membrane fusion protein, copper/silver efflux system